MASIPESPLLKTQVILSKAWFEGYHEGLLLKGEYEYNKREQQRRLQEEENKKDEKK